MILLKRRGQAEKGKIVKEETEREGGISFLLIRVE
jgi:hypothetical protein